MASTVSKKPIPLDEFVADIERRRQETGVTEITRNAGNRRTPSKRASLAAIKELGGEW